MPRTWLITGCSSGFGRLLAERLLDRGDAVMATARDVAALDPLKGRGTGRLLARRLDVTVEADIVDAVAAARSELGGIDVLVNNAGYGYFALQELFELEEVRRMYETNVFGLARMSAEVLPHFRERGAGCVVNVSSIGGRVATPRGGFYQSTKWAVEALSESLYYEASKLGVRVIVIEPGAYETDFGPRSARQSPRLKDLPTQYAELMPGFLEAAGKIFVPRQDPQEVVSAIVAAVDSGVAFRRIPVGRDAVELVAAREARPDAEFIAYMHQRAGYGVPGTR